MENVITKSFLVIDTFSSDYVQSEVGLTYKMTRNTLLALIILVIYTLVLNAQNNVTNKTDANGTRTGKWILPLDKDLNTIVSADSEAYHKVITYVTGKPIGFVNYYYKSGKLFFQTPVKSIDPDVYTDGEIKFFTPAGNVLKVLSYQNGRLNGQADYFYPDGKPLFHGNYIDDKKSGVWKQWEENGQYGIGSFKDELPDGKWTFYYTDGSLKSEGKFHNGKQTGVWTEYRENGDVAEGNYTDGIPDGTWVCNYNNDKPLFYGSYRMGKKNGFWKEWDLIGQLSQGNYIDDIQDGVWTMFDTQGNKLIESTYLKGKQDGEWKRFDNIGNVIETKMFKDGQEVIINEIQGN